MVFYMCDLCRGEIDISDDDFVSTITVSKTKYQVCRKCLTSIVNFISDNTNAVPDKLEVHPWR